MRTYVNEELEAVKDWPAYSLVIRLATTVRLTMAGDKDALIQLPLEEREVFLPLLESMYPTR